MQAVVVGLIVLLGTTECWLGPAPHEEEVELPFVWAKVDNFDPNNSEKYKQHYGKFFKGDSNVNFLYIDAEVLDSFLMNAASDTLNYSPLVNDLAKSFDANIYLLVHRYYRDSSPVKHPKTAEDFKYLTSQQALADIENFINIINNGTRNKKWITLGGSYGGTLALWHRQLYPQSTIGTIGSSGPVHAEANFTSFCLIAQNGYKERHPECYAWLQKAFAEFKVLLDKKDPQLKTLYPYLSKQYDIEDETQAHLFAYYVVSDVYSQIQYRLDGICAKYNKLQKTTPVQDLARCHTNTEFIGDTYLKSWTYQVCNEFGFFYSPDHSDCFAQGLYDIKKVFEYECERQFGSNFTYEKVKKKVQATLDFYKVDQPYPATNAIVTNSFYDPWKDQGLKKAASDTVKFFMIRNGTHCEDLFGGRNPDVYESRKVVKREIARWIRESKN